MSTSPVSWGSPVENPGFGDLGEERDVSHIGYPLAMHTYRVDRGGDDGFPPYEVPLWISPSEFLRSHRLVQRWLARSPQPFSVVSRLPVCREEEGSIPLEGRVRGGGPQLGGYERRQQLRAEFREREVRAGRRSVFDDDVMDVRDEESAVVVHLRERRLESLDSCNSFWSEHYDSDVSEEEI